MNIDLQLLVQVSRLFIPVVAIVGAFIAWHQYSANREKIRFELYDKRFNIYDSISHTLNDLLWSDGLSREQFHAFQIVCNEAQFLLPDEVYKEVINIKELVSKWYMFFVESDRQKTDKHNDDLISLEEQLEKLLPDLAKSFGIVLNFKKF